jgi:uncharacterized protein YqjF (DUF2071 family)
VTRPRDGLRRPWVLRMRWLDLLFAHWPVDPAAIRAVVPAPLQLDTFEGRAYLGIVPFRMEDVGPRGLPAPPVLGAFPELNVRTYVRHRGRGGVWFLSLDAASRLTVEGARAFFHLPYFLAEMSAVEDGDAIEYRSRRIVTRGRPAELAVRYRPTGPVEPAAPGSFESWLTDRMRLFAVDGAGRIVRTEIAHAAWPLQPAEAEFRTESMAAARGLALPSVSPHLLFSRRLDVRSWWPRRA